MDAYAIIRCQSLLSLPLVAGFDWLVAGNVESNIVNIHFVNSHIMDTHIVHFYIVNSHIVDIVKGHIVDIVKSIL